MAAHLAVAFVVALHRLTPRYAVTLAAATAVALGAATAARNAALNDDRPTAGLMVAAARARPPAARLLRFFLV